MPAQPIDKKEIEAQNYSTDEKSVGFTDETVLALRELGTVLQRIHNRLVSEGKIIEVDAHYGNRNRKN